ncbi:MAG: crossover junction endodeoxyribonuclease RuvC [Xenococcaceae cyanobacterium MO_167.B27]|nr:crossover junction endodeoxyribonuclease RuvC [Xenococcaceae cyanobacterium MO_167.B27]
MARSWLGIDPGLAIIGWAILEEADYEKPSLIDYGTIETSKKLATPQRLLEIERDIAELLGEFQPDNVAIEMPFFGRTIKAAGGVLQAFGVINLVCYRDRNIVPVYLHQSSWKCHLGNGRANKNEVAEIIQNLFDLETLPIDDTVDAIGIGYAGMCGLRNDIA